MAKIKINPHLELDVDIFLNSIAQLDTDELESLSNKVMALRAKRKTPNLSLQETQLLKQINHGITDDQRMRYNFLNEKLHEGNITEDEHKEFLNLVEQIELADAQRIHALIQLAQIRNISVEELMQQLQILRPTYG